MEAARAVRGPGLRHPARRDSFSRATAQSAADYPLPLRFAAIQVAERGGHVPTKRRLCRQDMRGVKPSDLPIKQPVISIWSST
jgi:hypothetical protein